MQQAASRPIIRTLVFGPTPEGIVPCGHWYTVYDSVYGPKRRKIAGCELVLYPRRWYSNINLLSSLLSVSAKTTCRFRVVHRRSRSVCASVSAAVCIGCIEDGRG